LTDDRLDIGDAAHHRMQWDNIAVADRRQRDEAEIDQIAGDGEIVFQWTEAGESIVNEQCRKTVKRLQKTHRY
jgi:hypothetical protein